MSTYTVFSFFGAGMHGKQKRPWSTVCAYVTHSRDAHSHAHALGKDCCYSQKKAPDPRTFNLRLCGGKRAPKSVTSHQDGHT